MSRGMKGYVPSSMKRSAGFGVRVTEYVATVSALAGGDDVWALRVGNGFQDGLKWPTIFGGQTLGRFRWIA